MSADMNIHNTVSTPAVAVLQPVNNQPKPLLKIAIDAHLAWHVIAVQEDGSSPKPPQRFQPAKLLQWIEQKIAAGCGNPRLRWALTELAWRLTVHQPEYRLCKKWRGQILDPQTSGGRKKQLLVALARGFGIDWWRIRTDQTTPDKLGLIMTSDAEPIEPKG
jgi:hypothetical protein